MNYKRKLKRAEDCTRKVLDKLSRPASNKARCKWTGKAEEGVEYLRGSDVSSKNIMEDDDFDSSDRFSHGETGADSQGKVEEKA